MIDANNAFMANDVIFTDGMSRSLQSLPVSYFNTLKTSTKRSPTSTVYSTNTYRQMLNESYMFQYINMLCRMLLQSTQNSYNV